MPAAPVLSLPSAGDVVSVVSVTVVVGAGAMVSRAGVVIAGAGGDAGFGAAHGGLWCLEIVVDVLLEIPFWYIYIYMYGMDEMDWYR